ncbi:MAG: hypothetical protein JWM02_232 [Frankiales bacterium]|nr:hypothetical protein [Frankiales bacterium]
MESSSIPTTTAADPATVAMLAAMARRRDLAFDEATLTAAATLDAWLAPRQLELRQHELSFLELVEPPTAFQWLEQGGRSTA